jgi:hypothetical protein
MRLLGSSLSHLDPQETKNGYWVLRPYLTHLEHVTSEGVPLCPPFLFDRFLSLSLSLSPCSPHSSLT